MTFPEINFDLRDHDFYPPESDAIPALYATEETPLDEKIVYARYHAVNGVGEWFVMELDRENPTRMIAFGWGEITDGELGYVDLVALESLLVPHEFAPPTFVVRDTSWTPRPWGEARKRRASERRTIILTDRAVATEDGMFDPASIARFVVEHARDERTRIYLVVDAMDQTTKPLREFAVASGFIVWTVSTTRYQGVWSHEIERVISREPNGDVVVCDPWFKSDDPRVTIHRRVTR